RWLIIAGPGDHGDALRASLESRGESVILVPIPASSAHEYARLLRAAFPSPLECRGILHLGALGEPLVSETQPLAASVADIEHAWQLGPGSVLGLVQALTESGWRLSPRVYV